MTLVPIGKEIESSDTSAIRPTISWPGITGYLVKRLVPSQSCTSIPLKPVASMANHPPVSRATIGKLVGVIR